MKRITILIALFCVISCGAFAQNEEDRDEIIYLMEEDTSDYYWVEVFDIPRYSLGISPSSVFNAWPGIQLSHDFRLNSFTAVGLETGFLFSSAFNGKGFRLKPSIEMYLFRDDIVGFFAGAAISSANIWEKVQYQVIYEEAYIKEFTEFRRRNLLGGYLTLGMKFNFWNHMFAEISGGLGPAAIYNSEIPELDRRFTTSIYPIDNGWSPMLGFYINLNFMVPVVW